MLDISVTQETIVALERQIATMRGTVEALMGREKALMSSIKDLKEREFLAQVECKAKIEAAKDAYLLEKEQLEKAIAPLRGLKQEVEITKAQLMKLAQDKLDAVSEVKSAKGGAIKEANDELAKQSVRLSKIDMAIQKCKEAVASL
jgi:chromosome segregation ATPase